MQNTGFYRFDTLWKNSGLMLALGAMFTVTFLLWGGIAAKLFRSTVPVDKIANVALLDSNVADKFKELAKPISSISQVSNTSGPVLLGGWASDVKNVCGTMGGVDKPVILLARQGDGYAAVKAMLDQETCQVFSKDDGPEAVWAVSDSPFMTTDSKPAYVLLNGTESVGKSQFRLLRQ